MQTMKVKERFEQQVSKLRKILICLFFAILNFEEKRRVVVQYIYFSYVFMYLIVYLYIIYKPVFERTLISENI